jgi:hypothetical protein
MIVLADHMVERLIQVEAGIHYGELPPPDHRPFVAIDRKSSIILSAPHGAITYRGNNDETWHEEDEYTAGMAPLLSDLCGTSLITTIWRTENSDPNEHTEQQSAYKQELRRLAKSSGARWFIDLHGAAEASNRLSEAQQIDLGTGKNRDYLPTEVFEQLIKTLEKNLRKGIADRQGKTGIPAQDSNRLAAFAYRELELRSVQIEMKPSVRVPQRRIESSMYGKDPSKNGGPYAAPRQNVLRMMQSLVDFIEYLKAR